MHLCLYSLVLLMAACYGPFGVAQAQPAPYVTVLLPEDISIAIPRNWVVISDNQRVTLDAAAVARLDGADIADFHSELAFAANYYDDSRRTAGILNVRYYPDETFTQTDSSNASLNDVQEIDTVLRQAIQKGASQSGFKLVSWLGTTKETIGDIVVFVSEYRRTSPKGGIFRVRLVRVLDADRSLTLTVSFREDHSYFLQPISDYITRSLKRELPN